LGSNPNGITKPKMPGILGFRAFLSSEHLGSGPNCIVFQKLRQYDVMLI